MLLKGYAIILGHTLYVKSFKQNLFVPFKAIIKLMNQDTRKLIRSLKFP